MKNIIYKRNKNVEFTELDEEGVVLVIDTGRFFRLNKSGTIILKMIDNKQPIKEIVTTITKQNGASIKRVSKDVCEFIELLKKNQIIKTLDKYNSEI